MGYVLILLGFLGFFAAIIYMIIRAIKRRFSKKFFFLPLACIILFFVGGIIAPTPEPRIPESIELAISNQQDEYDVNTDIPVEISIQPTDAKTDDLQYITDKDSITFSKSGINTGSEEGTYDIYVKSGDIKSNILTITVVDVEAREIAEKEAEAQRLAEAEKLAEEAALKEAEEQRLAEEAALKEAEEQRLAEEAAQAQARAQQKAAEEEVQKQAETEKTDAASQETTQMYASSTLNIRSSSSTDSEILGKLSVNDTVDVISTDGDWTAILYNGNKAYVASAYLSSSKTTVLSESYTDEVGEQVWIPKTGSKYHRRSGCSGMKNPTQVSRSKAESLGYQPCKKCY